MKLVKFENFKLEVDDELLLLKPFRQLYNADKTKEKTKFFDFLSILYFVFDPRSDYSYISDENMRLHEVCITNGFKERKFTDKEQECINLYIKLTTTTSLELLKSTKIAIDKVRDFLENIDMSATDDKGRLLIPINTITSALKTIPQLVKEIQEAERAVAKEIEESGRARGGNNKTLMDDGINLD